MPSRGSPLAILRYPKTLAASLITLALGGAFTVKDSAGDIIFRVLESGRVDQAITAEFPLCEGGTACATGTGALLAIPPSRSGYTITEAYVRAGIAGTTGTMSVQLRNYRANGADANVFSTPVSLDSTEEKSIDASSQVVINASNNTVQGHDGLAAVVTGVHSTPAKLATLYVTLSPPQ